MKPEPPIGSIVRDKGGRPWIREQGAATPEWVCLYADTGYTWRQLNLLYGPCNVLHHGDGTPADWILR